ncbi:MAG: glutaredoxin family protein [Candidatus Thiodiazotropha sp.]|nr:glutaredoxin family protein [Chromatiales bacterium]
MIELKFYHRQGCHLCDEMWEELSGVDGLERIQLVKVDIDRNSEIKALYGLRIPCLEGPDGVLLSEHYLDHSRLLSYLRDV